MMNLYDNISIYCECNDCGQSWETKINSQEDFCNIICPYCKCGDIITEQISDEELQDRYDNYIDEQIDEYRFNEKFN